MEEERKKHFERPTTSRPPSILNITLWTIFIGLVAGFSGYLFARSLFPAGSVDYLNFLGGQNQVKINIDQPFTDLAYKHQSSVAGIYKANSIKEVDGKPIFTPADFLGSAVVVTSDGWLMTTDQVFDQTKVKRKVVLGDKVYDVLETKADIFSGVVFLKVEANFLQPVDFQLTDNLKAGERLFTNIDSPNSFDHKFYVAFLSNDHHVLDPYLYSDNIDYYLAISSDLAADGLAAPYFNTEGDLAGLAYEFDDQIALIPAEYLKQGVKHLLDNTDRPKLGVYYINLENNSGFARKGNWVYHPSVTPVQLNSAAYKAGIKAGDQIVSVNNDLISTSNSLSSVIQNYRVGDKVILKISRDGVEQDIEVQL